MAESVDLETFISVLKRNQKWEPFVDEFSPLVRLIKLALCTEHTKSEYAFDEKKCTYAVEENRYMVDLLKFKLLGLLLCKGT